MSGKQCTACSVVAGLAPHCLHRYACPYTKGKYVSASTLLSVPIFRINTVPGFQEAINTQGNPISGYRRLRDFGGKQMTSSSDRVCIYPFFIAYILFI